MLRADPQVQVPQRWRFSGSEGGEPPELGAARLLGRFSMAGEGLWLRDLPRQRFTLGQERSSLRGSVAFDTSESSLSWGSELLWAVFTTQASDRRISQSNFASEDLFMLL